MSKDYKSSKKPSSGNRSSGGGGGSSVFAGLLIGLCLGVAIAVAAALYLNRAPNPFTGNNKVPAAAPPKAAAAQPPAVAAPLTGPAANLPATPQQQGGANPPAGQGDKERFSFYKLLPGQTEPKTDAPAKPSEATPPATVAPPKGVYLQAGAFQNESDADNIKAKLALMGVESSIMTTDVPNKGVIHRVRVGPLASAEEIDRTRAQLKVNGIESTIVKN